MRRFVSRAIEPIDGGFATAANGVEPPLPSCFRWDERTIDVARVVRTWRSSKTDRGDVYLKRHWFEIETPQGERAELYFDRETRRGGAHWWLFAFDDSPREETDG